MIRIRSAAWVLGLFLALAARVSAGAPPDTIVVLTDRDVEGLDPHTAGGLAQTRWVIANLYESLVSTDAEMVLRPGLADSWSNPDELTWDFRIPAGIRFHGGGILQVEDVVASLERARSDPRSVLRSALWVVSEIRAIGRDVVRLRTREPDAFFPSGLVDVPIAAKRCLESAAGLETSSCGTGPYRLVSRTPGAFVDLARFDGYRRGPAAIARARFVARSIADPDARTLFPPGARVVFGGTFGAKENARLGKEFVRRVSPGLSMTYLGFDLHEAMPAGLKTRGGPARNPFRDPRVRRAFALAIGSSRLTAIEEGSIPSQPVPGFVFGFDPSLPARREDHEAARRLIREAGYANGFDLDLDVRTVMAGYAAPVAADLAQIGIRARVRILDEKEYFARVEGGRSALYILRFSCRTGDAQEFLDKWVHSRDEPRGLGLFNFSYAVCPVAGLDAAIEAARRELAASVRQAKLQAVLRRVMEENLLVPLLSRRNTSFASPDVDWLPRADNYHLVYDMKLRR